MVHQVLLSTLWSRPLGVEQPATKYGTQLSLVIDFIKLQSDHRSLGLMRNSLCTLSVAFCSFCFCGRRVALFGCL